MNTTGVGEYHRALYQLREKKMIHTRSARPEYEGKTKSVVVNNDACLLCRACEVQCPQQAITVTE
ncbi:MAG: hypothetical protein AOA65_2320 [Candidatus Bathyarchaeota archaeon BA1]|nr:MAG: hypothetical protein AOA65_2320 [Candidatus Bathyarchaeota archaeon BA1]